MQIQIQESTEQRYFTAPNQPTIVSHVVRRSAGPKEEMDIMGIPEVKRTGGCTCRCGACRSQAHCRNIGSGCKVKL
jgi:hypothetical protein